MSPIRFLFIFAFILALQSSSAQIKHLSFGPHDVGFSSLTRYDSSRPAIKEQIDKARGRLLQINIWFPTLTTSKDYLTFLDYVELIGKELDENPLETDWKKKAIEKYFAWPVSVGADKMMCVDFLNRKEKMKAYKGASFPKKQFPLIMLVHGFAADHAWLGEYLASFGYVVMEIPVKGTSEAELDYETGGLTSQVMDYEYGLKILQSDFSVMPQKAAVVGFSFGGQTAMALSMKHEEIKAVVSLDGGIGSKFGANLLKNQRFYDPQKIKAPLLHLYNPNDNYTDLSWLKSLRQIPRYFAAIKNVEHGHFVSFGLLNNSIPGIMGKTNPRDAYETMMLLTKNFVDIKLKSSNQISQDFFENIHASYPWTQACIAESFIIDAMKS